MNGLIPIAPENTVFFFTSDHGTLWGEHGEFQKGAAYEEASRVTSYSAFEYRMLIPRSLPAADRS